MSTLVLLTNWTTGCLAIHVLLSIGSNGIDNDYIIIFGFVSISMLSSFHCVVGYLKHEIMCII